MRVHYLLCMAILFSAVVYAIPVPSKAVQGEPEGHFYGGSDRVVTEDELMYMYVLPLILLAIFWGDLYGG